MKYAEFEWIKRIIASCTHWRQLRSPITKLIRLFHAKYQDMELYHLLDLERDRHALYSGTIVHMRTFNNKFIPENTLAILYLCDYTREPASIKVTREIFFESQHDALEAFANTPNPASQLASGADREGLYKELTSLHKNLNNPVWVKDLGEYL